MTLHPDQAGALKDFCSFILCGHHEDVFNRCKELLENASGEYGGIPDVLYVLSGQDVDPDDPYGNVADEEKQLVKPQSYLVSSDAGAPALEDFLWFVENIKAARGLDFALQEEKFSDEDCIVEWLAGLSAQLDGLYIVNFDGASEDYHFTILNQEECEQAIRLFKQMTAHISGYPYTAFVITQDFGG